jgi:DNA-binding response OmpR family regulator
MKNILIVEDEGIVAMELESYVKRLGHNVIATCSNGDDAYNKAINNDVDLILMDINLKKSNGIDSAIKINKDKTISIIFITAYMDEKTIERAVSANPIAYLIKPFNRSELFASIQIAFKKSDKNSSLPIGDLIFDDEFSFITKSSELIYCGETVQLTKKERSLLKLFLLYKNQLLTIRTIEYEIWPNKVSNDSTRRALVSRLRAKINHKFIYTMASEGYIFKL